MGKPGLNLIMTIISQNHNINRCNHLKPMLNLSSYSFRLRKLCRLFPGIGVTALCLITQGCLAPAIIVKATTNLSVDPEFARTHDIRFKTPPKKSKVVLLYENKGRNVGRDVFVQALKDTGAFSEIKDTSNAKVLKKYPGWDIVHVESTFLGDEHQGWTVGKAKYRVRLRLQFASTTDPIDCLYSAAIWTRTLGGTPKNIDDSHPLMGEGDAKRLFARELVMAAFREAQQTGRLFQ